MDAAYHMVQCWQRVYSFMPACKGVTAHSQVLCICFVMTYSESLVLIYAYPGMLLSTLEGSLDVALWVQGMQAQATSTLLRLSMPPHLQCKQLVITATQQPYPHHHHHHPLSWLARSLADISPAQLPYPPTIRRPAAQIPHPPITTATAVMEMVPVFKAVHHAAANLLVHSPISLS